MGFTIGSAAAAGSVNKRIRMINTMAFFILFCLLPDSKL
jgi:hypothetical protein